MSEETETPKNYDEYLLYLNTAQGNSIKTLTEALKEVLVDVNIEFDESGLKIHSMDPGQIAFVFLDLKSESFEEFYCPKPLSIGVNMIALHKLLKTIGGKDTLKLFVTKENPEELGIQIQNRDMKINNNIVYNLMDVGPVEFGYPDVTFDSHVTMPCGTFQKYCRELATLDNHVKVGITPEGIFSLEAEGSIGKSKIEIAESEKSEISIDVKPSEEFSPEIGKFSLKFLNLFCKSSTLSPALELSMQAEYPLFIVYKITSLGTCKYCLSPQMTE